LQFLLHKRKKTYTECVYQYLENAEFIEKEGYIIFLGAGKEALSYLQKITSDD